MFRNIGHAPNSCYIAAIITAVWAQWDRYRFALTAQVPQGDLSPETYQRVLRVQVILNRMVVDIRGCRAVHANTMEDLRSEMSALGFPRNNEQQDASSLYEHMMDLLKVPMLQVSMTFSHAGYPCLLDNKEERYRFMPLPVPETAATIDSILEKTLLHGRQEVRRETARGSRNVRARVVRKLLPRLEEPLPLLLSRYDSSIAKRRTPISLPIAQDVSNLSSVRNGGDRCIMRLRSVVCHLGSRPTTGHYVTYTRERNAWFRWDDMHNLGQYHRFVVSEFSDRDGMPRNRVWREEIMRDSYLVFYDVFIMPPRAGGPSTRRR